MKVDTDKHHGVNYSRMIDGPVINWWAAGQIRPAKLDSKIN